MTCVGSTVFTNAVASSDKKNVKYALVRRAPVAVSHISGYLSKDIRAFLTLRALIVDSALPVLLPLRRYPPQRMAIPAARKGRRSITTESAPAIARRWTIPR